MQSLSASADGVESGEGLTGAETTVSEGPFLGLKPYEPGSRYFFGRAREIEVIASNHASNRLAILIGPPGCGKSSILQAGVVESLQSEKKAVVYFEKWQLGFRRPLFESIVEKVESVLKASDDPVDLRLFLLSKDDPESAYREREAGAPIPVLPEGILHIDLALSLPFDELVCRCADALGRPLHLIFDQFETYFLLSSLSNLGDPSIPVRDQSDAYGALDRELALAVNRPDVNVRILLAVRDDCLAVLDRLDTRILGLFSNLLRLRPLTVEGAIEATNQIIAKYNEQAASSNDPDSPPIPWASNESIAVSDEGRETEEGGGSDQEKRQESLKDLVLQCRRAKYLLDLELVDRHSRSLLHWWTRFRPRPGANSLRKRDSSQNSHADDARVPPAPPDARGSGGSGFDLDPIEAGLLQVALRHYWRDRIQRGILELLPPTIGEDEAATILSKEFEIRLGLLRPSQRVSTARILSSMVLANGAKVAQSVRSLHEQLGIPALEIQRILEELTRKSRGKEDERRVIERVSPSALIERSGEVQYTIKHDLLALPIRRYTAKVFKQAAIRRAQTVGVLIAAAVVLVGYVLVRAAADLSVAQSDMVKGFEGASLGSLRSSDLRDAERLAAQGIFAASERNLLTTMFEGGKPPDLMEARTVALAARANSLSPNLYLAEPHGIDSRQPALGVVFDDKLYCLFRRGQTIVFRPTESGAKEIVAEKDLPTGPTIKSVQITGDYLVLGISSGQVRVYKIRGDSDDLLTQLVGEGRIPGGSLLTAASASQKTNLVIAGNANGDLFQASLSSPNSMRPFGKLRRERTWPPPAYIGAKEMVTSLSFDESGEHVLSTSRDKHAHLWSVTDGTLIGLVKHSDVVSVGGFAPSTMVDGDKTSAYVVSAGKDVSIRFAELPTVPGMPDEDKGWAVDQGFVRMMDLATCLSFRRDGGRLAIGARSGDIWIWHPSRRVLAERIHAFEAPIAAVHYSKDGHILTAISTKGEAKRYADNHDGVFTTATQSAVGSAIAYNRDGTRLVAADANGKILRFLRTGEKWVQEGKALDLPALDSSGGETKDEGVNWLVFDHGSRRFAACTTQGRVLLFDAHTGVPSTYRLQFKRRAKADVGPQHKELWGACFASDDSGIFVGFPTGAVGYYPLGEDLAPEPNGILPRKVDPLVDVLGPGTLRDVLCVDVSKDGKFIGYGRADGTVVLAQLDGSGKKQAPRSRPMPLSDGRIWAVAFSPDGRYFAEGGEDGVVRIQRTDLLLEGKPFQELSPAHTGEVWTVSLGHNSMVSSGLDGVVRYWTPAGQNWNGWRHVDLLGHLGPVWVAALRPDGSEIASTSEDESLRRWRLPRIQEILRKSPKALWNESNNELNRAADGKTRLLRATDASADVQSPKSTTGPQR
jgi:WD40 repeat protein